MGKSGAEDWIDEAGLRPSCMQGIKRTSNLLAPIMQLTGHGGEVYSVRFNPDGECLASGSFDKLIYLWKTYGECPNYMVLKVGMCRWGVQGEE